MAPHLLRRCYFSGIFLCTWLSLIGAAPGFAAESDASHNACASALVTAFPDETTYRLALGFFEGRGAGDASTGGPLADFLEENFSRVPHVESAIAALRGESDDLTIANAIRFWNVVGMFPWPNNSGPHPVVALSRDGFPVTLLNPNVFAHLPLDYPWITDVAFSSVHEAFEESDPFYPPSPNLEPRYARLHTMHLALANAGEAPRSLVSASTATTLLLLATKLRELHLPSTFLWLNFFHSHWVPRPPDVAIVLPRTLTTLRVSNVSDGPLGSAEERQNAFDRSNRLMHLWLWMPALESFDARGVLLTPAAFASAPPGLTTLKVGPFVPEAHRFVGSSVNRSSWEWALSRLSHLREVNLLELTDVTLPYLPADLRSLTIDGGRLSLRDSALERFSALETLNVTRLKVPCAELARQLPETLASLNFSQVSSSEPDETDVAQKLLVERFRHLTRLQRVTLNETPFHSSVLQTLSPWVKELHLELFRDRLDENLAAYLKRSEALKSLAVIFATTNGGFLPHLPYGLDSLVLRQLSHPKLDGAPPTIPQALRQGLKRATYLRTLHLEFIDSDEGVLDYVPTTLRYFVSGPLARFTSKSSSTLLAALLQRSQALQDFTLLDEHRPEAEYAKLPASLVLFRTQAPLSDSFREQNLPAAKELRYLAPRQTLPIPPAGASHLNMPPQWLPGV